VCRVVGSCSSVCRVVGSVYLRCLACCASLQGVLLPNELKSAVQQRHAGAVLDLWLALFAELDA
jgi:hypothetical protein